MVVSLLSLRHVVEVRRRTIARLIFLFVGAVSPKMLSMVPNCLLYGREVLGGGSGVAVWIWTSIVDSNGDCVRKLHAKLLKRGSTVP